MAGFIKWMEGHLLPCPFKKLTGIDCPGCGFQRSVIALIKGDLKDSLHQYPATIPIIITCLFVWAAIKFNFDRRHVAKKILYITTGSAIMISYIIKMYTLYAAN